MITLDTWRERMRADLQLRDYRQRTQAAYELATRLFLNWAKTDPRELTEEHVRAYFLFLRETKKQAPSSINVAICALRFFCIHTLRQDWPVFELLRVNKPRMLPTVLSTTEVRSLLASIRHPVRRMALGTIYALGLRLGEGLRLETAHIDAERLMVWVRDGKGAKDRGVPLPRPLLSRLRRYWKDERPPSSTRFFFVPPKGEAPLHETTLQKTFIAARAELDLVKHASIHTLRHSYATHLLEAGISLRTIQAILGHKALRTTEIYLHVTQPGVERVQDVLDRLMVDL
jgi:site-specific recombinase XerD